MDNSKYIYKMEAPKEPEVECEECKIKVNKVWDAGYVTTGHKVVRYAEEILRGMGKNNSTGKYDRVVQGVRSILGQSLLDDEKLKDAVRREVERLLKKYNANDTKSKAQDVYNRFANENDKLFIKEAISEMKRYERNWNFLTTKQKKEISPNGINELRTYIKQAEERLKQLNANDIKTIDKAIRMLDEEINGEEAEWRTIKGHHIAIGENGNIVAGGIPNTNIGAREGKGKGKSKSNFSGVAAELEREYDEDEIADIINQGAYDPEEYEGLSKNEMIEKLSKEYDDETIRDMIDDYEGSSRAKKNKSSKSINPSEVLSKKYNKNEVAKIIKSNVYNFSNYIGLSKEGMIRKLSQEYDNDDIKEMIDDYERSK